MYKGVTIGALLLLILIVGCRKEKENEENALLFSLQLDHPDGIYGLQDSVRIFVESEVVPDRVEINFFADFDTDAKYVITPVSGKALSFAFSLSEIDLVPGKAQLVVNIFAGNRSGSRRHTIDLQGEWSVSGMLWSRQNGLQSEVYSWAFDSTGSRLLGSVDGMPLGVIRRRRTELVWLDPVQQRVYFSGSETGLPVLDSLDVNIPDGVDHFFHYRDPHRGLDYWIGNRDYTFITNNKRKLHREWLTPGESILDMVATPDYLVITFLSATGDVGVKVFDSQLALRRSFFPLDQTPVLAHTADPERLFWLEPSENPELDDLRFYTPPDQFVTDRRVESDNYSRAHFLGDGWLLATGGGIGFLGTQSGTIAEKYNGNIDSFYSDPYEGYWFWTASTNVFHAVPQSSGAILFFSTEQASQAIFPLYSLSSLPSSES